MSTWFLNIPRDDDFSGQPFPWHQRHGHSTAPTFPWKSSYDLAFSTHWALLHFSTALHLSRKHRACYPACSTNLGSKIPSLMSPPCSRCGKPTLRWCPRNRPEKTKMWFIILLPVTISSCPVAAKSPGAGARHPLNSSMFGASIPASSCGVLEGSRQSLPVIPSSPGARASHQSCCSPCSKNTAAAASTGRDEEKQQSKEEGEKQTPWSRQERLEPGRMKPCFCLL